MTSSKGRKPEPVALMMCKVIMYADIPSCAKAVGAALIDHVYWKSRTYSCWVSLETLMSITGYARSNVQIGVQRLAEASIIRTVVHGGRHGCNLYVFNLDEIRRRDALMQATLFPGRIEPREQGVGSPENGAQTLVDPKGEPVAPDRHAISSMTGQRGKEREREPRARSRWMDLARYESQSRSEAAWQSAQRRLYSDLSQRFASDKASMELIVGRIDADLESAATHAELTNRGAGLELVLDRVRLPARE